MGRSLEERREWETRKRALNEIARDNWDDPAWRREMAQELTETIYLGFEHENLLGYMTQVENADFDERVFVKEVRGLRAFFVARGGYIESSSVHAEVFEIPRETVGFHVYEEEDKLRTNFAETQATLVELGVQRLDATVNSWFFTGLQAQVTSASPYYVSVNDLSTSGTSAINNALTAVRDVSRDWEVAIVGRSTMTDQIVNALLGVGSQTGAGFFPELNEDLMRRGVLGTYRGAKIITLKNYLDDTGTPYFPANELWVIGRDASKFAFFGGMLSKEWIENAAWEWHYLARRDAGFVVHRPDRVRRIVDSSIVPYTVIAE
jgi:hypothetical protein